MADRDTLAQLAEQVGLALSPLEDALGSPEAFAAFAIELGWSLDSLPAPVAALAGPGPAPGQTLADGAACAIELGWSLDSLPAPVAAIAGPVASLVKLLEAGQVDASTVEGVISDAT